MSLNNMIAVVTGAGRGIGRAMALELASQGARVALVARSADELKATREMVTKAGGEAMAVRADITDRTAVAGTFEEVRKRFGEIDLLVNNAGSFLGIGPVWEVDPELWLQDVTTNMYGTFLCCRAAIPAMRKRKHGRIINLIGGGTASAFPYGSGYGSSKAAIMRFTESLAEELSDEGIAVFALDPGLVRTGMTEYQLKSAEGRKWLPRIKELFEQGVDGPPERAARLVCALAGGEYDRFSGRGFTVRDDLDQIRREAEEILAGDRMKLRVL